MEGNDIFNVYSCRKFVGVADGGILLSKRCVEKRYELDTSASRYLYLLDCIEKGTDGAYKHSLESEASIGFSVKEMSLLTEKTLKQVDYKTIRDVRKRNFIIMENILQDVNFLPIERNIDLSVPMVYPLYIENDSLRSKLIKHRIWVPQWWKYIIDEMPEETMEVKLSKYLFPIPIDQRYSSEDIESLGLLIKSLIKES